MLKSASNLTRISILWLVWIGFSSAQSQEKPASQFSEQSLKLRTALFHDSAIGAPLDSLVKLYQEAEREEELVALYKTHIEEYPADPKAKAVLVRILTKLGRDEVDKMIQLAAQQHAEFSHLQYLLSKNLRQKNINLSLEALSTAIDLETDKNRRSRWLGELLELSKTERGRELATYQMKKLLQVEGQTGQTMLSLGKVMFQHQFWELSRTALLRALPTKLSPEDRLEASVLVAKAEAALGMKEVAGQRLDEAISRLASDHHRRSTLMSLRISVIASDEERKRILGKKRAAYLADKTNKTAILDYTDLLVASGNRAEAIRISKESSLSNFDSIELEMRAMSLLEAEADQTEFVDFLSQKLESQEGRTDLRYRLVKAHYQMGDIPSANQDWEVVLASLEAEPQKRSDRILDFARFLRSITKPQAANFQYKEFLKLQPARLDVVRELCEGYLKNGLRNEIKKVVRNTSSKGASVENLLDLSSFLIGEQLFGSADQILSEYQKAAIVPSFEAGLTLAVVKSELGQRQPAETAISELRTQTDTPARYKQWLEAAMVVSENFDNSAAFFDREQGRFAYKAEEWTVDRIDDFLYLCETGESKQLTDEVAVAIKARLTDDINTALRVKLRELLVRTLERQDDTIIEIEEQLAILAKEDPDRVDDYTLRRALLQFENNRHDLAIVSLSEIELLNIGSAKLLRDSYSMLQEFGDSKLVGDALEVVTKLDPGDLVSWEKRLSLLAAKGEEEEFRSAIRGLLQGTAQKNTGVGWRTDSRQALKAHLIDSYWRSIASVLAQDEGPIENCIPLLESVQREAQGESLLWVEWTRALVFGKLNRKQEKQNAVNQLKTQLEGNPNLVLAFPDGLSIPLLEAIKQLDAQPSESKASERSTEILPLLEQIKVSWAFESDIGTAILQMGMSNDSLVALDNHGQVYRINAANGKLIWKTLLGLPPASAAASSESIGYSFTQKARQLVVTENVFVLLFDSELRAYKTDDCSITWKAPISKSLNQIALDRVNKQLIAFDSQAGLLNAFAIETGKLLWDKQLTQNKATQTSKSASSLRPLNTGLSVQNGKICVFGEFGSIIEAKTGTLQWVFGAESVRSFPVLLRENREHLSGQEIAALEQTKGLSQWSKGLQDPVTSLNYLSAKQKTSEATQVMSFLNHPGSLMSPAVAWSENRKRFGAIADAAISKEGLWLMDNSGLQYISLSLPIGARHYQVKGVWLGEKQGHAWVLDRDSLYHVNVKKNLVNIYPVKSLGKQVNGTIVGSWLYLRGTAGVAVYNVLSGKQISGSLWPKEMTDYLAGVQSQPIELYTWQGYIKRPASGWPAECFPNNDFAAAGKYFTVFGENRIVAISD